MGFRDHGYYGYAFIGTRPLQIIGLLAVIGITGHFVNQDSLAHISAPSQIVATLVVSCLALLWSLLSFTAYDDSHFPYFVTSALDISFMIPFIVIAGLFGGPLGATSCAALPAAAKNNTASLLAFQMHGSANSTDPKDYIIFVGDNQTTCFALMAVWGLVLALCVLFGLSGLATGLLFLGKRRMATTSYGVGGVYGNESSVEMATKATSDYSESLHGGDATQNPTSGNMYAIPPYPSSVAPNSRAMGVAQ